MNPLPKLPDHIEEYVIKNSTDGKFLELFEADKKSIDLKTDLKVEEVVLVTKLKFNNEFLESKGIGSLYSNFIDNLLRAKVSLDRKSRAEFVDIHKKDRFESNLKTFGAFQNLAKVKE